MHIIVSLILCCLVLLPSFCHAAPEGLEESPLLVATMPTTEEIPYFSVESTIFTILDGVLAIEQDLVLSKDNQLLVFDDIYLDRATDVNVVYPDRAREDGRFYVIDFTMAELKGLQFTSAEHQYLMSLDEQLSLLRRLEKKNGNKIILFPRLIKTWFHRQEGHDLCGIALTTLKQHGYFSQQAPVYLQSYDTDELKRARDILMPMMQTEVKLIQLIGSNTGDEMMTEGPFPAPYSYDWIFTGFGLRSLATYVDGIGFNWQPLENEIQLKKLAGLFEHTAKLQLPIHVNINSVNTTENGIEKVATADNGKLLDTLVNKLDVHVIKTDQILQATTFFQNKQSATLTIQEILPQLTNRGTDDEQSDSTPSPFTILRELQ